MIIKLTFVYNIISNFSMLAHLLGYIDGFYVQDYNVLNYDIYGNSAGERRMPSLI